MNDWNNENGPWGSGGRKEDTPQGKKEVPKNDFDEFVKKSSTVIKGHFGGGNGGGKNKLSKFVIFAVGIILLLIIFVQMFLVTIEPYEQGVVLRFGKFHRFVEPGVSLRLPYPIENVLKPDVTSVRKIEVGYRSLPGGTNTSTSRFQKVIPDESLMLTGDENIVDIKFEIQWKIKHAKNYLFNIPQPAEKTVKEVGESIMREIIGQMSINDVLAGEIIDVNSSALANRGVIQQKAQNQLQNVLENYGAGIEIIRVQMLLAYPPQPVMDAFRDVQDAKTDMKRNKNEAESYANDIIPRARGKAAKMIQEAQAYKKEVVSRAEGEAGRFLSVYNEYKQDKDITRKRMYFETLENALQGMDKIILDNKGGVVPYLPLKELK